MKKCIQYLADPVVDKSVPFIYSSVVTVMIDGEINGSVFLQLLRVNRMEDQQNV